MHHKLSFRRKLQTFLLSLLLILLTAAGVPSAAYTAEAASADTTMAVHFLDVGQGLSILVQSQGENLLYDGGDRGHSSFVVSYLQKQNVSTINYMISSHYDEDHVAGLVGCLDNFSVKNVIGADYVQDTKIYQSFENEVSSQGLNVQHPDPGTDFSFGSGKFTVLSPQSISSNDNDNSVAIRLENGINHFLFTGDAESAGEEAICDLGLDLSCDVIVPGHHGSATATTWDLLQQTVPEYAVISCGTGNSYGHPHKDTMDKLSDMGIQVFRMSRALSLLSATETISNGTRIPVMIIQPEMRQISVRSLPLLMAAAVQPVPIIFLMLRLAQILLQMFRLIRSQSGIWYGFLLQEANITGFQTAEI